MALASAARARACWSRRPLRRWHAGTLRGLTQKLDIQSRLAQAGCEIDPDSGELTPAIHLSSTYERDPNGGYSRGFIYSRSNNPTRALLERTIASLEGGTEAVAFASGMAAISATLHSLLRPGSHVALADDCYHGTATLLERSFGKWGVTYSRVDMSDVRAVEAALDTGASMLWCETPSNPLCKVIDVARVSKLAMAANVPCVVDSTWCTPALLRPLDLGASLVVHSCTKYIGGHSDLVGGIVVGSAQSAALTTAIRGNHSLPLPPPTP